MSITVTGPIQEELTVGSFFLNWGPIIVSAVAIIVAILVPSRIAHRQNQIAIFDKLYVSYSQFLLVKSFASLVDGYYFTGELHDVFRTRSLFCVNFETSFGYHPDLQDFESSIGKATAVLRKNEVQAYMLAMLISKNEKQKKECADMLSAVYESLFVLTVEVLSPSAEDTKVIDQHVQDFVSSCKEFSDKYSDDVERMLLCGKK